ncbi:MAG: hypothetical protein GXO86_08245 [Chlorobi bacterium]|nr:hypothetical protein [Chlorobiota bacterium]
MKYPDYFDAVEPVILQDDLALFLGTSEEGILEFNYVDIVKMAGHSCAVVAGAYLMTQRALKELYGTDLPKRGQIKVELGKDPETDNTGVTASVITNITGAAYGNMGFAGIQQVRFRRRDLLFFGVEMDADVRFTRLDTGASVKLNYRPGKVVDPKSVLMMAFGPQATEESRAAFPKRWQEMVRSILEHADRLSK